jgi:dihydrofolate reductase
MGLSLDGCIARTDGGLDWLTGAAEATTEAGPPPEYGYEAFFASIDVLVLGRKTYETVLGFETWPYGDKRCIVLTHRSVAPRHGEAFFAGTPADLVAQLAEEGVRRVYVDGGEVVRQFMAADLIDELTLSIVPVVLGEGRRLFGPEAGEHRLQLVAVREFPGGMVQVKYAVKRG